VTASASQRAQLLEALEQASKNGDVAYTSARAALLKLRDDRLLDLDLAALQFAERELREVMHRLDGVRFAIERLHTKAGAK